MERQKLQSERRRSTGIRTKPSERRRWPVGLLICTLLLFLNTGVAWADWGSVSNPTWNSKGFWLEDYNGAKYGLENNNALILSPENPYFVFCYAYMQKSGQWDWLEEETSLYVVYDGGKEYYIGRFNKGYSYNMSKGKIYEKGDWNIGSSVYAKAKYWYPSGEVLTLPNITGIRMRGIWSFDDKKTHRATVEKTVNFRIAALNHPKGEIYRSAPQQLSFKVKDVPTNGKRTAMYDFAWTAGGSTFDAVTLEKGESSIVYPFKKTYNNRTTQTIHILAASSENLTVEGTAVNSRFNEAKGYITVKGCPYPIIAEALIDDNDKWTPKVTVRWTPDNTSTAYDTNGLWWIYRKEDGQTDAEYQRLNGSGVNFTKTEYIDATAAHNKKYIYRVIYYLNAWGAPTPTMSTAVWNTISDLTYTATKIDTNIPFEIKLSAIPSDEEVRLKWNHSKFDKTGYKFNVYRKQKGTSSFTQIATVSVTDVNLTEHSYTDTNIPNSCSNYEYYVSVEAMSNTYISNYLLDQSTSGSTMISEFKTSKGFYANSVRVSWIPEVIGSVADTYVLYRRVAESNQSFTEVYRVTSTEKSFYYDDNLVLPGIYYEYKISVFVNCSETQKVSDSKMDIGFSQTTGTVSGRITYGTGSAVSDVTVSVRKDNTASEGEQYRSLKIAAGGGIKYTPADATVARSFRDFMETGDFSVQMYVRPDKKMTATEPCLLDISDALSIAILPVTGEDKYQVKARFYSSSSTVQGSYSTFSKISIPADRFNHLTFVRTGTKITLYFVNDINPDSIYVQESSLTVPTNIVRKGSAGYGDFMFGRYKTDTTNKSLYQGYLDEIRMWSRSFTGKEILTNYNRTLVGNESGLKLYYTMDEGLNSQIFDASRSGTTYNEHHGELIAGASSNAEVIPTDSQLGLRATTDVNGNYVIRGIPFSGEGTSYSIIPEMGIHQFKPAIHLRQVGSSSLSHNGTDFEDISSFPVSGSVFYDGTNYPVEGAYLYIDGLMTSKDGKPIQTNESGEFAISVPIGDHFIEVRKDNHQFKYNGRYPDDPNNLGIRHTFNQKISNLKFYDVTKVTLAGRIVGGEIQSKIPLGLSQSKANIGRAKIKLTSGYRLNLSDKADTIIVGPNPEIRSSASIGSGINNGKVITILTDSITGEFAISVPPIRLSVSSIGIPKNDEIKFDMGTFSNIDLTNPNIIYKDSIANTENGGYKCFEYNNKLMATYRNAPSFTVTDQGNKDGAFGDKQYVYREVAQPEEILSLYTVEEDGSVTYNYGAPVFQQLSSYKFELKAFESYVNKDAEEPVIDQVPLQGTVVTITNQLSATQKVYVEDGAGATAGSFVDLEENQIELDSLGKATYSFIVGFPNIVEPYTRGLSISYETNGQVLNWDGNDTFQAYVLGELPSGNNFVTSGPDQVQMILRDPPGTASSSFWEAGTTFTTVEKNGGSFITNNEIITTTHAGAEAITIAGTPAVGVITEAQSRADVEVGLNMNINISKYGEKTTQFTTTKKISTSDASDFVGASGDVFIGNATNILFGNARSIGFKRDEEGQYSIVKDDAMTTGSEFATAFSYTQNYVENILIPNLYALRNSMLTMVNESEYSSFVNTTNEPVYLTKLSKDDKRFASKNTDMDIWGELANTGKNMAKLEGPSYKMVLPVNSDPKQAYQDKVLWHNEQIGLWISTLEQNEKAKLDAIENRDKWLDTNLSFDAGALVENSTQSCFSENSTLERTVETLLVLGVESGAQINGVGVSVVGKTTTGGAYSGSSSSTTENCSTTGYSLVEDGNSDALTVDVFKAPDGFGAIFRTRGGQTSCPYEGQAVTKYYKPGTEISAATMQIEMPRIEVEGNDFAANVPSGKFASYTLKLDNLSEANEDAWFSLALVDESNPNGAKLTMDGAVLTDGRTVLVKAGETLLKTLQLSQTQLDVFDYNNIKLVLKSQCQADPTGINEVIADTITIGAQFVPSSSDVTLQIDNRVVNVESGTDLPIVVKDYDLAYKNFKAIRIQYKGDRDNDWKLAKEYVLDEEDKTSSNELLTEARISYVFKMVAPLIYDQTYQFRVITVSDFGSGEVYNSSEVITVVKDMSIPKLLSNPTPSDGILGTGKEISVVFNEPIKSGMLTKADNFTVTGVLNGYAIDHNVAMKFDNTSGAYTEASIDLNQRDFSAEMWLNYTSSGILIAHGIAQNRWNLSIGADGKLILSIGANSYTSNQTIPKGKWVYIAFAYDYEQGASKFTANVASDASTINLFNQTTVADYTGNGRLTIGENLTGAIHDLALWNVVRDYTVAQSQRNIAKTAAMPNLIGYWKMIEGNGKIASDVARNRHLTTSGNWYLNNVNKALGLNGSGYLGVNVGSCPVGTDQDYALELWFRADAQPNKSTLFSVSDSTLVVYFDNGALNLIANSKNTELSTTNYLDNNWHHLALNVMRNGNASFYVDGVVVKQLDATLIPALATDQLILGANRYVDTDQGMPKYRNYFKGSIDEVRLWKARLAANVIRSNRYVRLQGNEAGLAAYYPFEKNTEDTGGQNEVVGTLSDQIKPSLPGQKPAEDPTAIGTSYSELAPALQSVRPESNVPFTFVASDTKIVIQLEEDPDIIEGCTLKFTIKNVLDANNNVSVPMTWTTFVSRNQLKWSEKEIQINQEPQKESIFTVNISNQSGETENWFLSNLPTWLSIDQAEGTLSPMSSKTLKFQVASSMPIGNYEATLYMYGNNKINEPLVVKLQVLGKRPEWSVDPADFSMSMSVIGQLQIAGVLSEDAQDMVAAFVDNKCIGVASPIYMSRYDAYYLMMDIYGNETEQAKDVSFKVWDASSGNIYSAIKTSQPVKFNNDQLVGSMSSPVVWNAEEWIEQSISLPQGWSWTSLFVSNSDMSVPTLFNSIKSNIHTIKGKTSFAMPYLDAWSGKLTQLAIGDMYKIRTTNATTLNVIGKAVAPAETELTVRPNWNWIGVTPSYNVSVPDAFAGLTPENGDLVKGQSGFAIYQDFEWIGTLKVIAPGKGYLYQSKSSVNKTFAYPTNASAASQASMRSIGRSGIFNPVAENLYSGNMTMVAILKKGDQLLVGREVGVFVNEECRSSEVSDTNGLLFFTIPGEGLGGTLRFKVEQEERSILEITSDVIYNDDLAIGTPAEPYEIQLDAVGISQLQADGIHIFPTKVVDRVNVNSTQMTLKSIKLTDANGRLLMTRDQELDTVNVLDLTSYTNGVYLIVVETIDGSRYTGRVIK